MNKTNKPLPEFFDWKAYVSNYPDLQEAGINTEEKAIEHWLNYGCHEGRTFHRKYLFIAADITNTCNLRCPFCFNDFTKKTDTVFMAPSTFDNIVKLIPLVEENRFSLSCRYEPFLHPEFINFIEKIPWENRKKVFFASNLSIRISDDAIQRLSKSGLHYICISIDSLIPSVYESLRKGARFDNFMYNLERMAAVFSKNVHAPAIMYITMALKQNLDELEFIIEKCATDYHAAVHEIRHVNESTHFSSEWKQNSLLSENEWRRVQGIINETPHNCTVKHPPPVYYPDDRQSYSRNMKGFENSSAGPRFALRIDASGIVSLFAKEHIRFNINDIPDPYHFFTNKVGPDGLK